MASKQAVADAVKTVFTAASRYLGKAELDLFYDRLAGVEDDELGRAAQALVQAETWERVRVPTPAMVLAYVRRVRDADDRARAAVPEETEPVTSRADLKARIAWVREHRYAKESV